MVKSGTQKCERSHLIKAYKKIFDSEKLSTLVLELNQVTWTLAWYWAIYTFLMIFKPGAHLVSWCANVCVCGWPRGHN